MLTCTCCYLYRDTSTSCCAHARYEHKIHCIPCVMISLISVRWPRNCSWMGALCPRVSCVSASAPTSGIPRIMLFPVPGFAYQVPISVKTKQHTCRCFGCSCTYAVNACRWWRRSFNACVSVAKIMHILHIIYHSHGKNDDYHIILTLTRRKRFLSYTMSY